MTSDWIKLRGSHAIHKSVTCCKTSLSWVSETCADFVARIQRTTFYFLQQLFGASLVAKQVCLGSVKRADFVARIQRTTFYFLQQLFATCNNLICGGNRTNAVQLIHRWSLHFTCPHRHEGMEKEKNQTTTADTNASPKETGAAISTWSSEH